MSGEQPVDSPVGSENLESTPATPPRGMAGGDSPIPIDTRVVGGWSPTFGVPGLGGMFPAVPPEHEPPSEDERGRPLSPEDYTEAELTDREREQRSTQKILLSRATGEGAAVDTVRSVAEEEPEKEHPLTVLTAHLMALGEEGQTMDDLSEKVRWKERFEEDNGSIDEFVNSYQTVFAISPTTDLVMLRPQAMPMQSHGPVPLRSLTNRSSFRRPNRPHVKARKLIEKLKAIAYSSVAEALDVEELEVVYRRRGLRTRVIMNEVLQVTDRNFTFFLFDNGAIVWWGTDRRSHWIVEEDFFRRQSPMVRPFITHPHSEQVFDELFPVWCSWSAVRVEEDEAFNAFQKDLVFDHYAVPEGSSQEDIQLAIAHGLADAAKMDYVEHVLKKAGYKGMADEVRQLPETVSLLYSYRELRQTQGSLAVGRVMLQDVDESTFMWDHPWLKGFRDMTRDQYSVLERLSFSEARITAMTESLALQDSTQHRLFMIKSDWILIFILAADMLFMLMRLIVTLYLVEPDQSSETFIT